MALERSPFACDQCDKTFQLRSSLLRHQSSDHERAKKGLRCALCDEVVTNIDIYTSHVEKSHQINIEREAKLFNTTEGEYDWSS